MKPERVQFHLTLVPEWEAVYDERASRTAKQPEVTQIKRSFQFSCPPEAMAFVDTVADRAWDANVDVSIYVRGEYVSLGLPGDGTGVTEAHFEFAQTIDELVC